ncbi:MAG: PilZ domain-containing protein [Vulcanimicrobiota bacterium]
MLAFLHSVRLRPRRVEAIDFVDGMLLLKSPRPLPFATTSVRVKAHGRWLSTTVRVESFDPRAQIYRALIEQGSLVLELFPESRRVPRLRHCLEARVGDLPAHTEDISVVGVRLSLPHPLVPETVHPLELVLNDRNRTVLRSSAEVRWCHKKPAGGFHGGLSLLDLSRSHRKTLRRYIERQPAPPLS